ncbi:glycoside hydrolase family 18 protein [Streptomyces indicus]|uniref:chitinase n=1 Tax=Streptomyces indicus TaxID=417292 RepID=A0A1G9BMB7_9ACTN|nr:glycoside hydrolase family 18 protein [Streptomyces indicus]SDK40294.1 chitinase [Streptomyces indicus]
MILAFVGVLAITASLLLPAQAADAAGASRKVGYFSRAATDFSGENFQIRDLDQKGSAAKLTHLHYAFGDISPSGECYFGTGDAKHDYQKVFDSGRSVDGVADRPDQSLAGNFNQIKKLKAKYGLRTSISIGGGSRSTYFSEAASTPESREKFVRSCIDLYIKGNLPKTDGLPQGGIGSGAGVFDGIDLDWEYPGSPGNGTVGRKEDKQNFTLLLAEFRRQLNLHGQQTGKYYLLTAALAGSTYRINPGYELPKIFDYVDWAVVMAYDLHGAWETPLIANHQSALYLNSADPSETARSCEIYLNNFVNGGGVDPARLVLGVPFYSQGWTGVTNADHGLFQVAKSGTAPATDDYRNVKNLTNLGYTRYWDSTAKAAWLFNGSTFWTLDDAQVMAEKAAFVKAEGLGGIGIWSMDGDDSQGSLMAEIDSGLR